MIRVHKKYLLSNKPVIEAVTLFGFLVIYRATFK
jgi:hypothetical protein